MMQSLDNLFPRFRAVVTVVATGLVLAACADGDVSSPLFVDEMTASFSEEVQSTASSTMLESFTQNELDTNWEADRAFPTDGVNSVSAFGRDDVARLGIDSGETDGNQFRRTEGIKTVGASDFGLAVQVDLYLDPAWENNATRAGFWVVGDDGAGARDNWFGVLEFVNSDDHEGWRFWDSAVGWTTSGHAFSYGEWVTLLIVLDPDNQEYSYSIDGTEIGTVTGGENFIRELFLNSYNYGLDPQSTVGNDSYAAHWNAGVEAIDSKDDCRDGAWQDLGFKNQGQCIRYVETGKDSR